MWPVTAAAFCYNPLNLPAKSFIDELNDSKKLSEKKREELYSKIVELSRWDNPQVFFGLWVVDNTLIDEINIRQANREAMKRALDEIHFRLSSIKRKITLEVLIDGRDNYNFEILKKQPEYIVGWDWKIPEIWWASIIAKVFRDKIMHQYATLYPDLWIENHKWYWTKKHSEKLKNKSDITWIHRMSYKPVKALVW